MDLNLDPNASIRAAVNAAYADLKIGMKSNAKTLPVLNFHSKALGILNEETTAMAQAVDKVKTDGTLNTGTARARIAGVYRMTTLAQDARLREAARPLQLSISQAKATLEAAQNREPQHPSAALVYWARIADIRQQLNGLDSNGRFKAAQALAERADPAFPEIFTRSLVPILPGEATQRMGEIYQDAYLRSVGQLDQVREAQAADAEISDLHKVAPMAAWVRIAPMETGLGLKDLQEFPASEIVMAWPQTTKNAYLAKHGQEAYAELLAGKRDLSTALPVLRPGLVG